MKRFKFILLFSLLISTLHITSQAVCNVPKISSMDLDTSGTSVVLFYNDSSINSPYTNSYNTTWEIAYHETGTPFSTANSIIKFTSASHSAHGFHNLSPATSYDFYVRQLCDTVTHTATATDTSNWGYHQHHTLDTCISCVNYYIEMYDLDGDGWNGNELRINNFSVLHDPSINIHNRFSLNNGIYQMKAVQICSGDSLRVGYQKNSNNNHESFKILDHNFNTLYDSGLAPSQTVGNFFNPYSYHTYIGYMPCQPLIQPMILGGLIDMTLPNDNEVKGIELWVNQDINDLSNYAIEISYDGGGSNSFMTRFPNKKVSSGEKILITPDINTYSDYFGNCFQNYDEIINLPTNSGFDFDGNDAISLYFNNEIIERFGHPDIDGSGTAWDYTNTWAYKDQNQGSFNFSGGSWIFGDVNCGNKANYLQDSPCPYPICANFLSTEEILENTIFNAFPNPATDQITIVANEIIDEIILMDMVGKTVLKQYPNNHTTVLDINHLPKNIYLMKCKINNTYKTEKIIISE